MSFHTIEGLTEQERRRRPNSREFKGDGTPFLKVPGLRALAAGDGAVRVGDLELPAVYTYRVPLDVSLTEFETRSEPLVKLDRAPDGTPILLRNKHSNDGIWQPGLSIFVDGEWDEEAAAESKAASFSPVEGAQVGKEAQKEREAKTDQKGKAV